MDRSKYTKMLDNNNEIQYIEPDRVNRFLGQGWQIVDQDQKKSPDSTKVQLTVNAKVTKTKSRSKKKPQPEFIDEIAYDIDMKEGEDILLPEDINNQNNNIEE